MIPVYESCAAFGAATLLTRQSNGLSDCEPVVKEIFREVAKKGDAALAAYTEQFDGCRIERFRISRAEIDAAAGLVTPELKESIQRAARSIEIFHRAGCKTGLPVETTPGVICWKRAVPVERVGLYIPGGSAPLFSTVLMLAIPAAIAGCRNIILCTPPGKNGGVHPALLYAAALTGVHDLYRIGGAQAVAAMALGTETIPRVNKIYGPGNSYVTAAKMEAFTRGTAIDMPAGPSEVMVMADDTADAGFIAADLLSQAEHDPESRAVLLTTSREIISDVQRELTVQLDRLSRKETIRGSLEKSGMILCDERMDMVRICNRYAPEHLIICTHDAAQVAEQIEQAGSVFIGNYSPESAGDYCSGTNHTLPTGGFARAFSGLSVHDFRREITFQELSPRGLTALAGDIVTMALAEGLDAHAAAAAIRMERLTEGTAHESVN